METTTMAGLRHSLIAATSRRSLLAAATAGLLTLRQLAGGAVTSEAKKKRTRKRKRRGKRKPRKERNRPPVTRVDARCVGSSDIDFGAIENSRLAQTFTALSSGALVRAELMIAKDEDALDDWILRLSPVDDAGIPTNDILAETFVPDASVPLGGSTVVAFDFANPPSVVAGTTYALVLTRGEFFRWSARNGDICQGGAFHSSDQTVPFIETDAEFVFTTFVRS